MKKLMTKAQHYLLKSRQRVETVLYGAILALDAQTRFMPGKPLEFSVTEKVRKIS